MDDLISINDVAALAAARSSVAVSIYMPAHRKGRDTQQDPIRLKNLLQEAETELVNTGLRRSDAAALLEPVRAMLPDGLFWRHQSDGLAIFLSPEAGYRFRLPLAFEEEVVVTQRFHLKPLLPLFTDNGRFFVLALSQNEVRMLEGTRHTLDELVLTNVPSSLAEALRYDQFEKQLQFHTSTPSRFGGRSAVFHGHGAADELDKDRLLRFFQQIDRGVREMLRGEHAPLLLAAVDYLMPIYRQANSYPYLLGAGIDGNPEHVARDAMQERAWAIVEPYVAQLQQDTLARYRALLGTGRASYHVPETITAALHGRVEALVVPIGQHVWGAMDRATRSFTIHDPAQPYDEDLLDLAAIETLAAGGSVFALKPDEMPDGASVAAIFRY